jgi:N-acetylglucosamine kinase-like BadF-type ATPase
MSGRDRAHVAVLAVDGGNSKTDLLLVGRDGQLLASVNGPTISHQQVGLEAGMDALVALRAQAYRDAGLPVDSSATIGAFTLAGADTPADVRRLEAAIAGRGVAEQTVVVNDSIAPVRAGSERGWGVGVICGAGVNAAGIAPDGRIARFAALGEISGDWGGGGGIGMAALGAAVRARDGRGPRTSLEQLVPAHFGLRRPIDVTHAIEYGRMRESRIRELSPVVFAAANGGDAVGREILDRLADELAVMANAIIRRLHLTRLDPDVTLAGGVFRAADPVLEARIAAGVMAVAPRARVHRLETAPVLGAALLGLDRLEHDDDERRAAGHRLRAELIKAASAQP